jgi:hypothetical protein
MSGPLVFLFLSDDRNLREDKENDDKAGERFVWEEYLWFLMSRQMTKYAK